MFSFPPVTGYQVVHRHDEGERCAWSGDHPCYYTPTLYGRLRKWLRSWLRR